MGGNLSPERVPDEGPKQCQERLHVPRGMDNHQGTQVFPEPEEEDEVILFCLPSSCLKTRWGYLLSFNFFHVSTF